MPVTVQLGFPITLSLNAYFCAPTLIGGIIRLNEGCKNISHPDSARRTFRLRPERWHPTIDYFCSRVSRWGYFSVSVMLLTQAGVIS
jgi:hypothetical protein